MRSHAYRRKKLMDQTFGAFRPHISLDVTDLSRSVAFYSALFGQPPIKERPGYAKFSLAEPPLNFSMNERPHQSTGPGISAIWDSKSSRPMRSMPRRRD